MKGEWEFTFGDKTDYFRRKDELKRELEELQARNKELEEERTNLNSDQKLIKTFMDVFGDMPDQLTRFNGKLFIKTIDRVEVGTTALLYYFYGGECIKVNLEKIKKMI